MPISLKVPPKINDEHNPQILSIFVPNRNTLKSRRSAAVPAI